MNALELTIWSMALGAIAAVAIARSADLVARPSPSQLRGVGYHIIVFVLVLVLSGVLAHLTRPQPARLHALQVLAGPICVGLSNFWIRGWLGAHQRDRLMAIALGAAGLLIPLAGVLTFALPRPQQLPVAAGLSLLGSSTMLWLTVRGWLMGDRMALAMAIGCLMTLPAIGVLYALAMNVDLGAGLQALAALCAALSNGFTGFVLWRRDRHEWKARRHDNSVLPFDPVTKLHSGTVLVRKLIHALRRRRRTKRHGAVLAIMVFDVERVAAQVGNAGVNEVFIAIGSRIQRQVGVVNPVGRYWDRCFVALVETIHSPGWLRTLGLRVSTSLQQPIEVAGRDGERVQVKADIGVGVVHLAPGQVEVEDILHDAQRMAEAARAMRSRAAMLDPATGELVPVEQANLGPRRHAHASLVPHAIPPVQRAVRG
jgi:GGDEF domain-containing protein